jgi:hypothetical protein
MKIQMCAGERSISVLNLALISVKSLFETATFLHKTLIDIILHARYKGDKPHGIDASRPAVDKSNTWPKKSMG